MCTIQVSKKVYDELLRLSQGKYTFDEVISFLIDYYMETDRKY